MNASGSFRRHLVELRAGRQRLRRLRAALRRQPAFAQGGEFRVNTFTAGDQMFPTVGIDSSGAFIIAWTAPCRTAAAGASTGSATTQRPWRKARNSHQQHDHGDRRNRRRRSAPSGGFVVAFTTGDDVHAPTASTPPATPWAPNSPSTPTPPRSTTARDRHGRQRQLPSSPGTPTTRTPAGSATASSRSATPSPGVAQGANFQVNTNTSGDQRYPSIAAGNAGDFVITWSGDNQDGSGCGVYAQAFKSNGAARGGEFPRQYLQPPAISSSPPYAGRRQRRLCTSSGPAPIRTAASTESTVSATRDGNDAPIIPVPATSKRQR
jgi:hypothetical protein